MAHRNREPLEALCRDGAEEAKTPADMAAQSDIVFICVKTSEQVSDIIQRSDGLLASAQTQADQHWERRRWRPRRPAWQTLWASFSKSCWRSAPRAAPTAPCWPRS
ncbi:NAD(P)-binding domain-containing protein [Halomonas dongshanensis]|nr:NAD(P)-binding domain-containing protein [Halomonas dongshanensis]